VSSNTVGIEPAKKYRLMNSGEQTMRALEPDKPTAESHQIQITIHAPECYVEVVEVYRARENGTVFVQVTLAKVIEPHVDHRQNVSTTFGRLIS
jgi:hypothetical protein